MHGGASPTAHPSLKLVHLHNFISHTLHHKYHLLLVRRPLKRSSHPSLGPLDPPTCDRVGESSPRFWRNARALDAMAREDDNAGPTLLVIAIVVLILVLTTTALRITVRAKRHAFGGDDYTIAAASLLTIGRVTCQIISVPRGNGRHREFIAKEDYEYINFLTWLTQLFLFPILCLLKISVCLLVLRIKSTKKLRYGLWSLIVLLILTTLLPEIVLLAECSPVSAYWTSQHDKCWNPNIRIYSIYLQTCMSAKPQPHLLDMADKST